ncbi:MAG: flagellar basal body rod protein FlgC [Fimbriimonas sp.]
MTISSAMRASASGMAAERFRMDVISSNIANAGTARTPTQAPYRSRDVVLQATPEGVKVVEVIQNQANFPIRHIPGHPGADAQGNVEVSNVEPMTEMVNMLSASRAYEANIAAFNTAKGMVKSALGIGRV